MLKVPEKNCLYSNANKTRKIDYLINKAQKTLFKIMLRNMFSIVRAKGFDLSPTG